MTGYRSWEIISERHKPYVRQLNERMREEYRMMQLFHEFEETSPTEERPFDLEQKLDS